MIFVSATASQQLPGWVSVPPIITSLSFDAISGARVIAASTSVNGPVASTGNVSAKLANLLNQILNPIRSINGAPPFAPAGESCRHSRLGMVHRLRAVHTRTSTQRRMSMNIPRQIPANRNNLIGHIHRHIITRHTSSISQSPGPCQPSIPQSIIPMELGTPCIRNKRISPRRMLRP